MSDYGAKIKPREPVKPALSEGPLDQALAVGVDDHRDSLALLDSVRNAEDLLKRCPVVDKVDVGPRPDGKGVGEALEGDKYVTDHLYVNVPGQGLRRMAEAASEPVTISRTDWLEDPKELIWDSGVLAQLQAMDNAISHFLDDPGMKMIGRGLNSETRAAMAQRARELSIRLKDEALASIHARAQEGQEDLAISVLLTRHRLQKYVVRTKKEIDAGGLTQAALDSLFGQEDPAISVRLTRERLQKYGLTQAEIDSLFEQEGK